MTAAYPTRPPFFAHRFARLMAKVCLANDAGPDVCWLLTVVAMTEDAGGYKRPVTFWNGQLAPLIGCRSEDALARVRGRAVRAGWLHYEAGGKGKPGRYWVVVPDAAAGLDDAPTDEKPGEYVTAMTRKNAGESAGNPRGTCGENRGEPAGDREGEPAEHSSLTLTQDTQEETPPPPARAGRPAKPDPVEDPRFTRFWGAYPRKVEKRDAAKVFAKLNPDPDLLTAILAAVEERAASFDWQKDGGQFVPYPAGWLRKRRWEDEPPPATGPPPNRRGFPDHNDRVLGEISDLFDPEGDP